VVGPTAPGPREERTRRPVSARLGDDADKPRPPTLRTLGERESGTARCEEAVSAPYRAALEKGRANRVTRSNGR